MNTNVDIYGDFMDRSVMTNYHPENPEDCSICLEELSTNLYQLECNHIFHKYCIRNSFLRNKKCPLCRYPIEYLLEGYDLLWYELLQQSVNKLKKSMSENIKDNPS
jgi:hypothetical protein